MGHGEGMHDSKGRGVVWLAIMRYVKRTLPRVVILENAKGITQETHQESLMSFIQALKGV